MIEKTLILLKPDAIERKLASKIIERFEEADFTILMMRKGRMSKELSEKHYRSTETQLTGMGNKTIESMSSAGHEIDINRLFSTRDPYKIGEQLMVWNRKFMTSSDIIAIIFESDDAVSKGRDLIGKTDPSAASKGTIRGDFADDSILRANLEGRAVRNLVHASDKDGARIETELFEMEFF